MINNVHGFYGSGYRKDATVLCLDFSILLSCSLFYKISEVEPVTRSRSLNMLTGAGLKVWLRHRPTALLELVLEAESEPALESAKKWSLRR